jgi:hypothetical protein
VVENRKKIRLAFLGFPGPFNPTQIKRLLEQRYELVIDPKDPDYVIYSVFSDDFLQYPNAVRIFFTGENVHPDFNLCDYAFGYDWLEFGDRYVRCPNYQLYDQFKDLCQRRRTNFSEIPSDRRFCNFIYTNRSGHPFRDEFFHRLSTYRKINSPGAHLRNCADQIGAAYQGDWSKPKVQYQRGFKFSFAFENSSTAGYTTEKVVHALAADTIPLYWGNPKVERDFNPKRIINCHEFPSTEDILARIIEVDRDEMLYRKILDEPFFSNDRVPDELLDHTILSHFSRIFDQPKERAFRRNPYGWGARYERERRHSCMAAGFLNGRGPLPFVARRLCRLWRKRINHSHTLLPS